MSQIFPSTITNIGTVNYEFTYDNVTEISASNQSSPSVINFNIASIDNGSGGMTKSATPNPMKLGDTITYTVSLTNNGNVTATNIYFIDTLPQGMILAPGSLNPNPPSSIPVSDLGPNSTTTVTFSVILATLPTSGIISNTANVKYNYTVDPSIPNGGTGTGNSNTFVGSASQAIIDTNNGGFTKTASPVYPKFGDTITYTISLKNTGNATATNIYFTDTLPQGTVLAPGSLNPNPPSSIPVATLGPNSSATVTFKVILNTLPSSYQVSNQASVVFNYTEDPANPNGATGNGNSNSISSNTIQAVIDTSNGGFTKTASPIYPKLGDTITYTVSLTNTGNVTATNIYFIDTLPQGTILAPGSLNPNPPSSIPVADLGPNSTTTVTFDVILATLPSSSQISNQATVKFNYTQDPLNPNGATGSGNSNNLVTNASQAIIDTNNGGFTKTASSPYAIVGSTITYTISLKNTGNATASNIYFTDTLPQELVLSPGSLNPNPPSSIPVGNIGPNSIATVSFNVIVTTLPASGSIPNTASVIFNYTEDPANPNGAIGSGNSNSSNVNVQNPELLIAQSSNLAYATRGDVITFTTTITNIGDTTINAPTLFSTIPAQYYFIPTSLTINGLPSSQNPNTGVTVGNLSVGQVAVIKYDVEVLSAPITNPVTTIDTVNYSYLLGPNTVSASQTSNPTNVTIKIVDLSGQGNFEKASNINYVGLGDTITYTVSIQNTGNAVGTNTTLIDTLPNSLSFVNNSLTVNGTTVPGNITSGVNIGTLGIDQLIIATFQAVVVSVPSSGVINNSADVYFNFTLDPTNPDGASGNATSSISSITALEPNFSGSGFILSQSVDFITMNEYVTYTVTIANSGNTGANNVILTDILPAELQFKSGSVKINNISYSSLDPNAGISLLTISQGETKVVTYQAKVISKPVPPVINNSATLDYTYTVNSLTPNSYSASIVSNTTTLNYIDVDLIITSSSNRPLGSIAGDTITYTVNLTNDGQIDVSNVIVSEILSSNLSFVPGSVILENISQPTYSPIIGIPIGIIPVGETFSLTFEALVLPSTLPYITEQPSVGFSYQLVPTLPIVATTELGPIVSIDNLIPNLQVNKTTDRKTAAIGTTITYQITVQNEGNVDAINLVLIDVISPYLEYAGNLIINGTPSSESVVVGAPIGDLAIGATTTVLFDVVLVDIPPKKIVENTATVNFEYNF